MTNQRKIMRQAKALLKMFAEARRPLKPESPYVRMAKVMVQNGKA